MDFKKELKKLIEIVKEHSRAAGSKLTNEQIAKRLGYERPYLSQLIGPRGVVNESHILVFKSKFKDELKGIIPTPGDPTNADTALLLAFLKDYIEYKAVNEGLTVKAVRAQIAKRAERIREGLESGIMED